MGNHEDSPPYAYELWYELADGRWWQATVVADSAEEARTAARAACPEPDAKLILHDHTSAGIAPIIVRQEVGTPHGWTGRRDPALRDMEAM